MRHETEHSPQETPEHRSAIGAIIAREVVLHREWLQLLTRDWRKYGRITCSVHLADLTGASSGMRPSYHFCRHVDNLVDGDAYSVDDTADDIPELLDRLAEQITLGGFDASRSSQLLRHALHSLPMEENSAEVRLNFMTFLRVMKDDHRRRAQRIALSGEQLHAHYDRSFGCVHNIALIALKSRHRTGDLLPLSMLQGRMYAVRDLPQELGRGEINVPLEVIKETGLPLEDILTHPNPITLPRMAKWKETELQWARDAVRAIRQKPFRDGNARTILHVLLSPIQRFIDAELKRSSR